MIRVDLSGLLPAIEGELNTALSLVSAAVQQSAQAEWQHAIFNQPGLSSFEKETYLNSLSVHVTGPFSVEVVADSKLADEIETGRPARDIKKCCKPRSALGYLNLDRAGDKGI